MAVNRAPGSRLCEAMTARRWHWSDPPRVLVPLALRFGSMTPAHELVCARSALAIPRIKAVADLLARELAWTPKRR
jgi:hypothetical protein